MEFKDQSARDLRYHNCSDPAQLKSLSVLERGQASHNQWDVFLEFAIVGESHFVRLSQDGQNFFEVLVCVPIEGATGLSLRNRKHFQQTQVLEGFSKPELQYDINVLRSSCMHDFIRRFRTKPTAGSSCQLLDLAFPQGELHIQPTTSIRYQVYPQGIEWETLHVYPQENEMVWSSSKLMPIKL